MHGMCVPLILKEIQLTFNTLIMPKLHFEYIKQDNGSIRVQVQTLEEYVPPSFTQRLMSRLRGLGRAAAYAIHR